MRLKGFAILMFLALPAAAQEAPAYCRLLPQHKPATGVEYVPGVDVHGKPVAPADLNSNLNVMNKAVVIPIEVDLAEHFTKVLPAGVELKPAVAAMAIHPDGRVSYGEADISPEAYALCGQVYGPPHDGQPAADAVTSKPVEKPLEGEVIEGQYP